MMRRIKEIDFLRLAVGLGFCLGSIVFVLIGLTYISKDFDELARSWLMNIYDFVCIYGGWMAFIFILAIAIFLFLGGINSIMEAFKK